MKKIIPLTMLLLFSLNIDYVNYAKRDSFIEDINEVIPFYIQKPELSTLLDAWKEIYTRVEGERFFGQDRRQKLQVIIPLLTDCLLHK